MFEVHCTGGVTVSSSDAAASASAAVERKPSFSNPHALDRSAEVVVLHAFANTELYCISLFVLISFACFFGIQLCFTELKILIS